MAEKQPDAIVCTRDYPVGPRDRDFARNDIFGPVLGSKRVFSRTLQFERSLVTRQGDHTSFQYPNGHPRRPEMRHDWFVSSGDPDYLPGRPATSADFATSAVLVGFMNDTKDEVLLA